MPDCPEILKDVCDSLEERDVLLRRCRAFLHDYRSLLRAEAGAPFTADVERLELLEAIDTLTANTDTDA